MDNKVPLYDTGILEFGQKDLNKIFHTKGEQYLTIEKGAPVKRIFNWIPSDKRDPPLPPESLWLKKAYGAERGVVDTNPKSEAPMGVKTMWDDGTYDEMVNAVNRDNRRMTEPLRFAPDRDFDLRMGRLEAEQDKQANIANFFQERQQMRQLEQKVALAEFGLSMDEIDMALAKKRVEDALSALKEGKARYIPSGAAFERKMRLMAEEREREKVGDMDLKEVPREPETTSSIPVRERGKGGRPIKGELSAEDYRRLLREEFNIERGASTKRHRLKTEYENLSALKTYKPIKDEDDV